MSSPAFDDVSMRTRAAGNSARKPPQRLDPVHAFHADVEQTDIGPMPPPTVNGRGAVVGLGDDLEAVIEREFARQAARITGRSSTSMRRIADGLSGLVTESMLRGSLPAPGQHGDGRSRGRIQDM